MEATPVSPRRAYPSDLNDAEWSRIEPLLPPGQPGGRPRTTNVREVFNAILYLLRTGCGWRHLPHDFPPEGTVRDYFHAWQRKGVWQRIQDALRRAVRVEAGREPEPSAGVIDSQSTKSTRTSGVRGYDAGKKIKGIKRHILVDTLGLVVAVVVLTAGIQDRDGAKVLFEEAKGQCPRLKLIWADGAYAGELVTWTDEHCGWTLTIVKRSDDIQGFKVLPRRWVVERTFAWLNNYRRLSKDYEFNPETSTAMIHVAMIDVMLRRLGKKPLGAAAAAQLAV
jgi:putative transposase